MAPVTVALRFDTTGRWATVRLGEDLVGWADRMAATRGNQALWRTVAASLFSPAYPGAYAALVLLPERLDLAPSLVLRLAASDGPPPATLRDGGGDRELWIDEPALEPYETGAGTARRVLARLTTPADPDGSSALGVVLAYWWWFPDIGRAYELRTVMTEYVDLQRALPEADALAASARRDDAGPLAVAG